MHIAQSAYRDVLMVKDADGSLRNYNFLFVAQPGYGKSIGAERIISQYYENGYTIIFIRDAKDNLEQGFCMFKPKDKRHLKKLEEQGELELAQGYPVKIYHPLISEGIPNRLIPEINFFTMDIKSLGVEEMRFILEEDTNTISVDLFANTVKKLSNNEGYFRFLHRASEAVTKKTKIVGGRKIVRADPNRAFLPISEGTISNIDNSYTRFRVFEEHSFIMPSNYERNLDILKIINDNKHYHIFTCRYTRIEKIQDFMTFWLLNEIDKNKANAKHPILIVFDEIRKICPNNPKGYHKQISSLAKNIMSLTRSLNVSTISTVQVHKDVDDDLISSYNQIFIGHTKSAHDIDFIQSKYKLDRQLAQELPRLERGEFIWIGQDEISKARVPLHAHCEEGYKFDEFYEKEFPDKMKNYSYLSREIKEIYKKELDEIKEDVKKKEMQEEEFVRKQSESRQKFQNKIKEMKEQGQQQKQERKANKELRNKLIAEIHEKSIQDNEPLSANKIKMILKEKHNIDISESMVKKFLKTWKSQIQSQN